MPLQIEAKPAPQSELVESRQANMQRTSSANYCTRRRCLSISVATFSARTEVLAVLLMAAKFGLPVCPHAGGVGLCEYVQHISIFDYVAVSGSLEDRVLEYVDHLHEHFDDPVTIRGGRYMPPAKPGYSVQMKPESLREYGFPGGAAWS